MNWLHPSNLGFAVRSKLADIGHGARLFARLMQLVGAAFARPALVRDQVHFLGNYSLAIIAVSGLFVGFVLACRGITRCSAMDPRKRWAFWWHCRWCANWARWSRLCCSQGVQVLR